MSSSCFLYVLSCSYFYGAIHTYKTIRIVCIVLYSFYLAVCMYFLSIVELLSPLYLFWMPHRAQTTSLLSHECDMRACKYVLLFATKLTLVWRLCFLVLVVYALKQSKARHIPTRPYIRPRSCQIFSSCSTINILRAVSLGCSVSKWYRTLLVRERANRKRERGSTVSMQEDSKGFLQGRCTWRSALLALSNGFSHPAKVHHNLGATATDMILSVNKTILSALDLACLRSSENRSFSIDFNASIDRLLGDMKRALYIYIFFSISIWVGIDEIILIMSRVWFSNS